MPTTQTPLRTRRYGAGEYELLEGTHAVGWMRRAQSGGWIVVLDTEPEAWFKTLAGALSWIDRVWAA